MPVDMERPRDGYRGRYRDHHGSSSTNRDDDVRPARGNYRGRQSHGGHSSRNNGNYSSLSSNPNTSSSNYRSSRTSLNSRPISSRNGPSTYHHHHHDDYLPPSLDPPPSSRTGGGGPSAYYENHPSSSRFDRSTNNRDVYPSLLAEQPILSGGPPSASLYYGAANQTMPPLRERGPQVPSSSHYAEGERSRYAPPSASSYRRDSPPPPPPPPPLSSYRNERLVDYGSRSNNNNDLYGRGEYPPPTPPNLSSLSVRGGGDPYGDMYRNNDYGSRSERYDLPPNRNGSIYSSTGASSRDYHLASASAPPPPSVAAPVYRGGDPYREQPYRTSSVVSMPSPPPPPLRSNSPYVTREQYASAPPMREMTYRTMPPSRDYPMGSSSRSSYASSSSSTMDHQPAMSRSIASNSSRNSNGSGNRGHDYRSSSTSYRNRSGLKRSGSRFDDMGPTPSKRPMRR